MNEEIAGSETGRTKKFIAAGLVAFSALLSVAVFGLANSARADEGTDRNRATQVQDEDHNCPNRESRSDEVDA